MFEEQLDNAYKNKKISQAWYEHLKAKKTDDHDELIEIVNEFIHAMTYAEYYITLERIEKGEEMLSKESDEKKKSEYRKLLNDLTIKLDSLRPKGESA